MKYEHLSLKNWINCAVAVLLAIVVVMAVTAVDRAEAAPIAKSALIVDADCFNCFPGTPFCPGDQHYDQSNANGALKAPVDPALRRLCRN